MFYCSIEICTVCHCPADYMSVSSSRVNKLQLSWVNSLSMKYQGVETILKVEGPDLMASVRSVINPELCLSVLDKASFCKAFGIRTNGKWYFMVPYSTLFSRNVVNNMSFTNPISIHFISSHAKFNMIFQHHYLWKKVEVGVNPRKNVCKPRPSICEKMIPCLIIMLKPNKIPRLKLNIAIIFFCLIKFLL